MRCRGSGDMFNSRKMEEKWEGDIAIGYVIYQRLYFCLRWCGGRCVSLWVCIWRGDQYGFSLLWFHKFVHFMEIPSIWSCPWLWTSSMNLFDCMVGSSFLPSKCPWAQTTTSVVWRSVWDSVTIGIKLKSHWRTKIMWFEIIEQNEILKQLQCFKAALLLFF